MLKYVQICYKKFEGWAIVVSIGETGLCLVYNFESLVMPVFNGVLLYYSVLFFKFYIIKSFFKFCL